MIIVKLKKNKNVVYEIEIKGHAEYDTLGKDIVCASVSTMAITIVNSISSLDDSIDCKEKDGFLKITLKEETDINQKLLNVFIDQLSELESQYPKNIEIRNED